MYLREKLSGKSTDLYSIMWNGNGKYELTPNYTSYTKEEHMVRFVKGTMVTGWWEHVGRIYDEGNETKGMTAKQMDGQQHQGIIRGKGSGPGAGLFLFFIWDKTNPRFLSKSIFFLILYEHCAVYFCRRI